MHYDPLHFERVFAHINFHLHSLMVYIPLRRFFERHMLCFCIPLAPVADGCPSSSNSSSSAEQLSDRHNSHFSVCLSHIIYGCARMLCSLSTILPSDRWKSVGLANCVGYCVYTAQRTLFSGHFPALTI